MKAKRKTANLSVVVKGANGNDLSPTNPVYVRISDTVRPITAALSVTKNAGTNYFNADGKDCGKDFFIRIPKSKTDMFGSDSPLYIELGEVRPVIDKWLTRDMTDPDYQYKITETARERIIRDVCYLIFRKIPMFVRQSLSVKTTPMKPAKKAGTKVKKVNKLKGAKTAKAKKALKAKKK